MGLLYVSQFDESLRGHSPERTQETEGPFYPSIPPSSPLKHDQHRAGLANMGSLGPRGSWKP